MTAADAPRRLREDEGSREAFALAVLLSALAGWVDALGYLRFQGLFVSFMSGNSTQAAVAVAHHDWSLALEAARAILVFVAGVILGELMRPPAGRYGASLVLAAETGLLWAAFGLHGAGEAVVACLLGLAMGLQNATVHRAAGIAVALTYVTGTLVHVGRTVAAALRGAGDWRAILIFLALWMALVAGGLGGALLALNRPSAALLVAAVAATGLTGWSLDMTRRT